MRLLVTRPADDAAPLAEALQGMGVETVLAPLLTIEPIADAEIDLRGVQALLFTSANGVRAFAHANDERALPVLAVGDATARAAADTGFAQIESAGGDARDLAGLAAARLDAAGGALFHAAGRDVAGPLREDLEARGFEVRRVVLYRAQSVRTLPDFAAQALAEKRIDGVLHFSPRTAKTFVNLVKSAELTGTLSDLYVYCLSQAVADESARVHWRGVRVAATPTQAALLACIAEDLNRTNNPHRGGAQET